MSGDINRILKENAKPCDWPEDFDHENGMYSNTCACCGVEFMGHKRRVICRECSKKMEDK